MQAAGPPGGVGAVQDLNHLSAAEAQLVILQGLEVIQRPGPPHPLLGKTQREALLSPGWPSWAPSHRHTHGRKCAGPVVFLDKALHEQPALKADEWFSREVPNPAATESRPRCLALSNP